MTTRGTRITKAVRDEIVGGRFIPGSRLSEASLASRYGTSRTPVRAALATLYAEGLLDYAPNCGYVVRSFSAKDVTDIYEVRANLEGMASRLAAERGLANDRLSTLEQATARMNRIVRTRTWTSETTTAWCAANDLFHDQLYFAAANAYLTTAIRRTRTLPLWSGGRCRMFVSDEITKLFDRATYARSQQDHAEILEAVVAREGTRAEALMRDHIARASRLLSQNWQALQRSEFSFPRDGPPSPAAASRSRARPSRAHAATAIP